MKLTEDFDLQKSHSRANILFFLATYNFGDNKMRFYATVPMAFVSWNKETDPIACSVRFRTAQHKANDTHSFIAVSD